MWASEHQKWAANLQPTLNKVGGEASLKIFVTDCLKYFFFFFWKEFFKEAAKRYWKKVLYQ